MSDEKIVLEVVGDVLVRRRSDGEIRPMSDFRKELTTLLNRHSMENGSDTPDFILADHLIGCLANFDATVSAREAWYGREDQ